MRLVIFQMRMLSYQVVLVGRMSYSIDDNNNEGASATRYLNPLLGKIELSIMSCRKHVSSSNYFPFTIEMSGEMNLKVFSMILQRS